MKVILAEEVKNLGRQGQTVEVKDGYARNFLLPKKLAYLVNAPEAQEILRLELEKKKEMARKKSETESKIQELKNQKITFLVKVNKKGKPYKAVKKNDIAKKIGLKPSEIEAVTLDEVGEFEVKIHRGQQAIKVKIEPEK